MEYVFKTFLSLTWIMAGPGPAGQTLSDRAIDEARDGTTHRGRAADIVPAGPLMKEDSS